MRDGLVVYVDVHVGRKVVEVPCTYVVEHGRGGFIVEHDELVRAIEDAAGVEAEQRKASDAD